MTDQLTMPPGPAMTTGTLALAGAAAMWRGVNAGGITLEELTGSVLGCWRDLTAGERAELVAWAKANRAAILRLVVAYVIAGR